MLCCTHKSGNLFGVCLIGVFIYIRTKKSKHTFPGEIQTEIIVRRIENGGLFWVKL